MSIWKPKTVTEEPVTVTSRWEVVELKRPIEAERTRHIVCWCGEGRVSSRIAEWDPISRRATTRSGRQYQLDKDPGMSGLDAQYVFSRWIKMWHATDIVDVSDQYD